MQTSMRGESLQVVMLQARQCSGLSSSRRMPQGRARSLRYCILTATCTMWVALCILERCIRANRSPRNNLWRSLKKKRALGDDFDVFPNHAVLVPDEFDRMIHDNFKVSIFREPLARVLSSFSHDPEAINRTIRDLDQNKRVSFDGGPCGEAGELSSHHVPLEFFDKLDEVMLTEQFDLSLMMLRRKLGWALSDMVYLWQKKSTLSDSKEADLKLMQQRLSSPLHELNPAWQHMVQTCLRGDERVLYQMAKRKF
eukprot:TRINITY_DN65204_c0_g1_i1.p1 TRINITY_DN65204_c0_g1~~TRINITY_DN65204_c0_g1_i1.p1  ORF type:complete len:254 (-),score=36.68 TRINITY_DN65204_c0_g1_i1:453-1214(-)